MRLINSIPRQTLAIGTTLAMVARFDVAHADVLSLDIVNTGANALNAFQIRMRSGNAPGHNHILRKSSGYTAPDAICFDASAEPSTLASAASAQLSLDVSSKESVEIWASAGTGTSVDIVAGNYAEVA